MTDRDKLLAIALILGHEVVVKKRSICVPAWGRRFLTDEMTGEIKAVQDMEKHYGPRGGPKLPTFVTIARAEA